MKKLILVFAAIAITAGAYAQTDSANRSMNQPNINNTNDGLYQNRNMNNYQNQNLQNSSVENTYPDGVMMQKGKMIKVKKGHMTILEHTMTMSNGTKIKSDGTYIKKDGTKMTMKDGQHLDMSGNIILLKTNKDKNMYLVPDSTRNIS